MSRLSDPPDEAAICECRACPACQGEGVYILRVGPAAPFYRATELELACDACGGAGSFAGDCDVHMDAAPPDTLGAGVIYADPDQRALKPVRGGRVPEYTEEAA